MTATVAGVSTPVAVGAAGSEGVVDEYDVRFVQRAVAPLDGFNRAGVLAPADVHVAARLARLAGDERPEVRLALALAVRAPRLGHVCVDLATAAGTVTADEDVPVDVATLDWPEPDAWLAALHDSPLVSVGVGGAADRPLRLVGSRCYLDRYWRYEQRVVRDLLDRAGRTVEAVDRDVLRAGLDRLFPRDVAAQPSLFDRVPAGEGDEPDRQRLAAATCVLRRLAVIAGGPGTGKTTTVTRALALLDENATAAGRRPPRIAVAAPTGKAADRLEEAIRDGVASLRASPAVRGRLLELEASTLHRLLGSQPWSSTRFRHDRTNPLPHDVVVVDETSMVSLSLMAKLVESVRADARLVLVGDPEQLASVEAGAVLGDIVGPAGTDLRMSVAARTALTDVTGEAVPAVDPPAGTDIGDGIVVLTRVHRFRGDSGIADLAAAIQKGDADTAVGVLGSGRGDVRWVPAPSDADPSDEDLAGIRAGMRESGARLVAAARAGDARSALEVLKDLRVLCAHRRGPHGVATWVPRIERWLVEDVDAMDTTETWYPGRPVLVTENDYQLGIYNGDVGVTITTEDGKTAVAFEGPDGPRRFSPVRLEAIETVYAMTVHKSQGSQFNRVVVVLPGPDSPILTRELLYTAVTRARHGVTVVGSEEAFRAAIGRRIQRASGLRGALWGAG